MREFQVITDPTTICKNKKHKQFYFWTARRIPCMQLLGAALLLAVSSLSYELFDIWITTGIFLYKEVAKLIIALLFFFWFLPRLSFFLGLIKAPMVFKNGDALLITKDGYQKSGKFYSWNGKKIIIGKHGIAVLSFWRIYPELFTELASYQKLLWRCDFW